MNSPTRLLAAAALVVALAGCAPGGGSLGTISPPPASPSPAGSSPPPDLTPEPSAPNPTPTPTGSAAPSPAVTPRPTAAETTVVRAYFLLGDSSASAGVVPVLREIPATAGVGAAAMRALLAGPSAAERTATPALASAIPPGARLLDLAVAHGIATVDLSAEFESGGGSTAMIGRLAQVVFTLTQFPTVQGVAFEIEGRPVAVFSGEGIVLDGPLGRDDFDADLPAIFVDRPAWGAALGSPGRITGTADVFEAAFHVALLDGAGRTLVEEPVMATCGTGCRGTFDVTLRYVLDRAQWGTLRVWALSARDGTPENVREYPVYLTPPG